MGLLTRHRIQFAIRGLPFFFAPGGGFGAFAGKEENLIAFRGSVPG